MGVVSRERLELTAIRKYDATRDAMFAQAVQLLEQRPKVRVSCEGYLNQVLQKHLTRAIEETVMSGATVLSFDFDTTQLTKKLYSMFPEQVRVEVPPDMLRLVLELMLVQQKYQVDHGKHLCSWSMDTKQEEEPVTATVVEDEETSVVPSEVQPPRNRPAPPTVPALEDSGGAGSNASDAEVVVPNPPKKDEDPPEAHESGLVIGKTYAKGDIERRIDAIVGEKVSYTVTKGNAKVREGSTGSVAIASFARWAASSA